ncbi:spore germination protein GerPE [Paenibacillus sp. GCM10027627]|uniref:spore germination protein GerPE n=1 Tax=unclassified Paenibacillus TaxID=185978 RepID=UPI0036316D39
MNSGPYPYRTSQVGAVSIISAASAGSVQFGDRGETDAKLQALAVQRAEDHAKSGNVYFESYEMFERQRPVLVDPAYDAGEVVTVNRINECPIIHVGWIEIIASGSAASILIGNSNRLTGDSRIKHIRQYPKKGANKLP